jgi:L-seryl-tRNA(Ser) seleniumtransferase
VAREAVDQARAAIAAGQLRTPAAVDAAVADALAAATRRLQGPALRRLYNGTGVLLHTNAGRAPLSAAALAAVVEAGRG